MFDKVPLGRKLILIGVVALLGLAAVAWFGLHTLHGNLRADRAAQTQNLVLSTMTAVGSLHDAAQAGELSEEQAQHLALDLVRALRYANDDYFFILNANVEILAHGATSSLEGRDLGQLEDANGTRFAADLVRGAMRNGGAFVPYLWPRGSDSEPIEKISYAEYFEPWGWIIATGIYVDDVDTVYFEELANTAWISLGVILLMGAALALLSRSVTRPINRLSAAMRRLAHGDHNVSIPARDWSNEIGLMAATVQVFKDQAIEKSRLEGEQLETKHQAEVEKRELLGRLADGFEGSVGGIVQAVSSAAKEMQSTAKSMSSVSENANRQSANVAAAATEAATNVETVASAAKQLGQSIADISQQVQQQRDVAGIASEAAATTNEDISALAGRADKIGEVIGLITGIAEQTNLLALNATIEAARAGEAGKGFAVVASEVKSLANQTAKATDEIGDQIRSMQEQTGRTVTSIGTITAKIDELNQIASGVAAAVAQQNAATQEISRNADEASVGTGQVNRSIDAVSDSAGEAGSAANMVLSASDGLSRHAAQLTEEVQSFLRNIRAV